MKQFLYTFLSTSIPFGFFMGLLFKHVGKSFLLTAVLFGALFGLAMATILWLIQAYHLKKTGNWGAEVKLINHAEIELSGTKQEVLDRCRRALDEINNCTLLERNLEEGLIRAKAGMTMYTWGDDITIRIEQNGDDRFKVLMTSRPSIRTTLVDYGKNLDNINRMKHFLIQ